MSKVLLMCWKVGCNSPTDGTVLMVEVRCSCDDSFMVATNACDEHKPKAESVMRAVKANAVVKLEGEIAT